jgi:hypothetical protein
MTMIQSSVADPDPGSGAFFYPWTRDPDPGWKKNPDSGSGMNIPVHIFENLVSVFLVQNLFLHRSGSRILSALDGQKSDPGSWMRDKHPGSSTLIQRYLPRIMPQS